LNPKESFSQSTHEVGLRRAEGSENPLKQPPPTPSEGSHSDGKANAHADVPISPFHLVAPTGVKICFLRSFFINLQKINKQINRNLAV